MNNLNLVILAAGMGSRFGGLKQMTPIDTDGNFIIDYSIYDALKAGANHVVFVIKKEIEKDFRETIGARVEKQVRVSYVFQEISEGRKKPWGTGHAVMTAKDAADGPFATINADDFYGREAYMEIFDTLKKLSPGECALPGYELSGVMSETGGVSRGICIADDAGMLLNIDEHHKIQRGPNGVITAENSTGEQVTLKPDTLASMNIFGFTAEIFDELSREFEIRKKGMADPATEEFYLSNFVQKQMDDGRLKTRIWRTKSQWSGITFKDEVDALVKKIAECKKMGIYPERLWG